ncbi:ABC transporter thiamine pyrophosphate-binding lipoprotein p37/Cypl [Mycoplasmopsis cricetuli]|uniref:ABC transporter thiamine pyrophosphate-binding lipoprotein p37/Cypl n=1 Tax=Mycoplasmopsis cricetuli TaxID=171283 RepID=UPI000470B3DE|nr:hypothetical protein [Mycoplasmopsis cricetuli]
MKKRNLFWKKIITLFPLLSIGVLSVKSCQTQTINWDANLTIIAPVPNNNFTEEEKLKWEKLVSKKFNELKNNNNLTKNYQDVKINLKFVEKTSNEYQNVESGNLNNDFIVLSFSDIINKPKEDLLLPVVQTETLKFLWSPNEEIYLDNSLYSEKMLKLAEKANEIQLENTKIGSYPKDWVDKKDFLKWDGSKFSYFYQDPSKETSYTDSFFGAILISGTKKQRDEIKKAWIDKDWEKFKKFGIAFKKSTSISKFIVQAKLIAKNFNLSYKEIVDYLKNTNNKNLVLLGKSVENIIGNSTSENKKYNIVFSDDGVFNWTYPLIKEDDLKSGYNFKPENYPDEQVRYLTLAGPIFYNVILARKNIDENQKKFLAQSLSELKYEENTYGIYSGFNKFKLIDKDEFEKKYDIQKELIN